MRRSGEEAARVDERVVGDGDDAPARVAPQIAERVELLEEDAGEPDLVRHQRASAASSIDSSMCMKPPGSAQVPRCGGSARW